MSAPNLDCMNHDDLMNVWQRFTYHPIREGRKLFSERPKGYSSAARNLGHYAVNKSTAMSCRERGDIQAALIYEKICDNIYQDLPAFARW
jgi:hypothetical protein